MTLALIFVLFFGFGPVLFLKMAGSDPHGTARRWFLALALLLAFAAFALRFGPGVVWSDPLVLSGVSLVLMWLAWVAVLSCAALFVYQTGPAPVVRRWTTIGGAICTTVPWFGLVAASGLAG